MADAEPIPRLGPLHDCQHEQGRGAFEGDGMSTLTDQPEAMGVISDQQLIDFVYAEAKLLDSLQFEDWLDLFAEDGYYWMPLTHDHTDPCLQTSLCYEDKLLLRVRIERLAGYRTFSQPPKSRCHHLLRRPEGHSDDAWH